MVQSDARGVDTHARPYRVSEILLKTMLPSQVLKMNSSQSQRGRSYRPDIDGLRAIAILSVVLYHAGVPCVPGGFLGVDIFFVISGYLIGGHIYSDLNEGRFSFLDFYRLRAKRILPAFFAMLACLILTALLILSPSELRELGKTSFAAVLSVSNIYFSRGVGYFRESREINPMLMTWSLGVEEQFYAVVSLLMFLLARIRRSLILPAVVSVCVASLLFGFFELHYNPLWSFYLLPARAWELGAGVVLAIAGLGGRRTLRSTLLANLIGISGVAMMLAPVFLVSTDSSLLGVIPSSLVLGSALTIAAPASWINTRLLSFSPLVYIGRISYSWYLWHWPVLGLLRIIMQEELRPVHIVGAVVFSFGLASASYFFIEQPLRKSSRTPAPLLLRYALLSVAFLAACWAIWRNNGIPQRFPDLIQIENEKFPFEADPCLTHGGYDGRELAPPCYPAFGNRPAVALWGDSHAAALVPALRPIVQSAGYGFAQLTRAGCRPQGDPTPMNGTVSQQDAACSRFNHEAFNRLMSDPEIRIVIIADAWGHMDGLQQERKSQDPSANRDASGRIDKGQCTLMQFLEASIRSLQANGKQVVVMDDVPSFDTDPASLFWTSRIPVRHAIATWLGFSFTGDKGPPSKKSAPSDARANALLHDAIRVLPGVISVDLKHTLCDSAGQCSYNKDGHLLYFDHQHLSAEGAAVALQDFKLPLANP